MEAFIKIIPVFMQNIYACIPHSHHTAFIRSISRALSFYLLFYLNFHFMSLKFQLNKTILRNLCNFKILLDVVLLYISLQSPGISFLKKCGNPEHNNCRTCKIYKISWLEHILL